MEWYLPVIWAGLIGTAVAMYVILDGFDLGIGILFPFARNETQRDQMMRSVAPFWDGNETWLVLGGGGLWVAFPVAYAVIMPAMYLPVIVMLLALVFRGVAGEVEMDPPLNRLGPVGEHEPDRESRCRDRLSLCRKVEHLPPEPGLRSRVDCEPAKRGESDRHAAIQQERVICLPLIVRVTVPWWTAVAVIR